MDTLLSGINRDRCSHGLEDGSRGGSEKAGVDLMLGRAVLWWRTKFAVGEGAVLTLQMFHVCEQSITEHGVGYRSRLLARKLVTEVAESRTAIDNSSFTYRHLVCRE